MKNKIENEHCELGCDISLCKTAESLHAALDRLTPLVEGLSPLVHKVEEIYEIVKNENQKKKTQPVTLASGKICVNELILVLQLRQPDKTWTSEEMAKEIGCSSAAIRKTKMWKLYQEHLDQVKSQHAVPHGYKNKQGDIEAF